MTMEPINVIKQFPELNALYDGIYGTSVFRVLFQGALDPLERAWVLSAFSKPGPAGCPAPTYRGDWTWDGLMKTKMADLVKTATTTKQYHMPQKIRELMKEALLLKYTDATSRNKDHPVQQWGSVMDYLVNPPRHGNIDPCIRWFADARGYLEKGTLLTGKGMELLLEPSIFKQVRSFVFEYVLNCVPLDKQKDALGFICYLSCHDRVPKTHFVDRAFMSFLHACGAIVLGEKTTEVTSIGANLVLCATIDPLIQTLGIHGKLSITCETTLTVHFSWATETQRDLVLLMCEAISHMDRYTVARFTRRKASEVYERGINANQMIRFFKTFSKIPDSVSDQLHVWESDHNRVKIQHGMLYRPISEIQYRKIVNTPELAPYIAFRNDTKLQFYMLSDGIPHLNRWLTFNK
jgi:hypothetical protein